MTTPYYDAATALAPIPSVQVLPPALRAWMLTYGEQALARRAARDAMAAANVSLQAAQQGLSGLAASARQELQTLLGLTGSSQAPAQAPCNGRPGCTAVPGAPQSIDASLVNLGALVSSLAGDANAAAARAGTNPAAPFLADPEYSAASASSDPRVRDALARLVRSAQGEVLR